MLFFKNYVQIMFKTTVQSKKARIFGQTKSPHPLEAVGLSFGAD